MTSADPGGTGDGSRSAARSRREVVQALILGIEHREKIDALTWTSSDIGDLKASVEATLAVTVTETGARAVLSMQVQDRTPNRLERLRAELRSLE